MAKQTKSSQNYEDVEKNNKKGKSKRGNKNRRNNSNNAKAYKQDAPSNYGGNDISWYSRYPELLTAVSRVPFAHQPGALITKEHVKSLAPLNTNKDIVVDEQITPYPGIMSLTWYPTVGSSENLQSPINVAAKELYAKVRSKYSSSLEADSPDLMMYMLALDSLYTLYEDYKRAYYLINQYTPYNRLYPTAMLKALGYNPDDLLTNKANVYSFLVEAGAQLSKYACPDLFNLTKRHTFMSANIYADAPINKAQHYVFDLGGIYRLTFNDGMTGLEIAECPANATFASMKSFWNTAISRLMNWDTAYTILGYMERAYGDAVWLKPSPPVFDGILDPVYNPEILIQIQNATSIPIDVASLHVTQDPLNSNMLTSTPRPSTEEDIFSGILRPGYTTNHLLSMPTNSQPNEADLVIATRLTSTITNQNYEGEDDYGDELHVECGTEIVTEIKVYCNQNGFSTAGIIPYTNIICHNNDADTSSDFDGLISVLSTSQCVSAFAYHPTWTVQILLEDSTSLNFSEQFVLCDVGNIAKIEGQSLHDMHKVCIYSEFNCFSL